MAIYKSKESTQSEIYSVLVFNEMGLNNYSTILSHHLQLTLGTTIPLKTRHTETARMHCFVNNDFKMKEQRYSIHKISLKLAETYEAFITDDKNPPW